MAWASPEDPPPPQAHLTALRTVRRALDAGRVPRELQPPLAIANGQLLPAALLVAACWRAAGGTQPSTAQLTVTTATVALTIGTPPESSPQTSLINC